MERIAALLLAALLAAPACPQDWNADPLAQAGAVPGRFDSYTFTLEWTPAFCEGKADLAECSSLRGSYAADHLALHGLWPDQDGDASHSYGYCGVAPDVRALDRAATWCRMPDFGLSAAARARLAPDMPGVASCLQNHEWYKHGSCSGLAPDDYFSRAAALAEKVAATAFGRFLTENAGRTVAAADLLAAFEAGFGAGSRGKVALTCTNGRGGALLLDVRLKLPARLRGPDELAAMLLPASGAGNCPARFLLDAAR